MSFSFNVRAATKAAVFEAASVELERVIAQQPVHATDRPAIEAAIAKHVDLFGSPGDSDISLSVSGSIGIVDGAVKSVNVSVHVWLVPKA